MEAFDPNMQPVNSSVIRTNLARAAGYAKSSRPMRFVRHPLKMVYPKMLRLARLSDEARAQTIWGESMVVVLPESVSTKIWRYGYFEEDVCLYILHCLREGMTFIDIGSHFGFFTMLGSHLVGKKGKILAFEPTPSTYKKLEENVIDRLNVETFNIAAFSENTEIDFFDYGIKKSAYNSAFGSRSKSLIRENKILVNARKVDDILEERGVKSVDCIKIDAESSEFHVLEGMKKTLRRYKPKIILEVGDFDISGSVNSQEVIKGLQHLNYSAWEASNGKLVPHVMRDQYEYGNLLFSAD